MECKMTSVEICKDQLVTIDLDFNQESTQNLNAEVIGVTETKNYVSYLRGALLLLLFNVACIAFLLFGFELLAWQSTEATLSQTIKVVASLGGILLIVIVAKTGDASAAHPNFYYI